MFSFSRCELQDPPPPGSSSSSSFARVRMMKWEEGEGGGKTVPPTLKRRHPAAAVGVNVSKNILLHETHNLAQKSLEYIRKSLGSKSIVLSIGSSCKRKGEEEEEKPAALSSAEKRASCLS